MQRLGLRLLIDILLQFNRCVDDFKRLICDCESITHRNGCTSNNLPIDCFYDDKGQNHIRLCQLFSTDRFILSFEFKFYHSSNSLLQVNRLRVHAFDIVFTTKFHSNQIQLLFSKSVQSSYFLLFFLLTRLCYLGVLYAVNEKNNISTVKLA